MRIGVINMAPKLGKCRLCLKLGDFYSIFTMDNNLQLAEMVMECSRVKVFEGDGLPDKICSECIQKLSSAHVFKQQCERSDQELRRNYVPLSGFSKIPSLLNSHSSDSAFSNHTDISSNNKIISPTGSENSFGSRNWKRSVDSNDNASTSRELYEYNPISAKRVEELQSSEKKARSSINTSAMDLDDNDENISRYSSQTDSDEPLTKAEFKCRVCGKAFTTSSNMYRHFYLDHRKALKANDLINTPQPVSATILKDAMDVEDKLTCDNCEKTFKLKIILKQHQKTCGKPPPKSPMKELVVSLKPIDADAKYGSYGRGSGVGECKKNYELSGSSTQVTSEPLQCNICEKQFTYKKALVTHEEKHRTGEIKVKREPVEDEESINSLPRESRQRSESESSQEVDDKMCDICEKQFSYKHQLIQHKRTKHNMSSGTKRAKICLKDCFVRCLICDIEMKFSAINTHNMKHMSMNIKPRNLYTCAECDDQFKSRRLLASHITVHRLNQTQMPKMEGANLADFCEVVVKAEPLAEYQIYNDCEAVLPTPKEENKPVNLGEFNCPICNKTRPTSLSLKKHMNCHSNVSLEKKLKCFVCKESFQLKYHYKLHMTKHYNDPNPDPAVLTCAICNRKSKNLRAANMHMMRHKQTRFVNKDYHCPICKKTFQFRSYYLRHMRTHYKLGESINSVDGSVQPNMEDDTKSDSTHTCHQCGKICDSEMTLKNHIIWHKSKSSLFGDRHECHLCGIQLTNKRILELHIRTHFEDNNGPYKCHICGKGFIDEVFHKKHILGHRFNYHLNKKRLEIQRRNKVKCPVCVRYFPDLVKLISHLQRMHPESKMIQKSDPDAPPENYFSCKLCAKVFLDERRLRVHEQAHSRKPELFRCKFCGKKTNSLKSHKFHVKTHLTQKYTDNPLKCMHCDETFIKGYGLHHHLRDAHDINETWMADSTEEEHNGPLKDFQCSICLKVLANEGNFKRHIDFHNSSRCNYCFDYFSSLKFLEGHLAFSCMKKKLIGDTEVYPKKLNCHICYKAFHLQVKLDCHLLSQHGIRVNKEESERKKDFVCDYCFKVFDNEFALSCHKRRHRTVKTYGCMYCNRKFNNLATYRIHKSHHLSQHNVDNPTKCEHCDETFVLFREMISHMRDVHGDDKDWIIMPKEPIEEKCDICNKVFFNLHNHLVYHEKYRCKKCFEYFFSQVDYNNHPCVIDIAEEMEENKESNPQPKYTECNFCFKPTTKTGSKRLHEYVHKTSGALSCRFCPLKFKTMLAFNKHALSHQRRKYVKKPIKCRQCSEKFVRYGPFIRHMKTVHDSKPKLHYRTTVKPEPCAVCGDDFPNLHNHYRAHLQNQCQLCQKYFTSSKLFASHECGKQDADPHKVFTSDVNLANLIKSYTPKDEKDNEKYFGNTDTEDEDIVEIKDEESQNTTDLDIHTMAHRPIISDVLSLYKQKEEDDETTHVINLTDDDPMNS